MQFHPCYAPHSGLYGLGIVGIHGIGRAEDMFYSKPIGQPDYGSQITGILHVIQRQTKGVGYNGSIHYFIRLFKNSEHLLGSFQKTGAWEFFFGDFGYVFHRQLPVCGKPFSGCNQEAAAEMPQ